MSPDETPDSFDFDDLLGEECDFYGVQGNCFRLDDMAYEAIEEEEIGGLYDIIKRPDLTDSFGLPIARVVVEDDDDWPASGCSMKLIDLHDGHEWLRIGTGFTDVQWQYEMVFEYTPKAQEEL